MLGAGELILQFRHFLLGGIQNAAKLIRETHIGGRAVNFWTTLQLRTQALAQLIYIRSDLPEKRSGDPLALVQKRGKKVFVGNLRMITLRSEVLRSLQSLLHLLRVFIDAHG